MKNIKSGQIVPYENNAKKHPKKQIQGLYEIVKEVGWRQPVMVNHITGAIIVGHGRYETWRQHKKSLKEIWVINDIGQNVLGGPETKPMNEAQEMAYRLADNKLSETDWDMELVTLEMKEIKLKGYDVQLTGFDKKLIIEPEKREENIPVIKTKPTVKPGDIYQLGDHRLMCGSSTDPDQVEQLLDGDQIDLLLTDPPYNVDYEGGTGMKIMNDKMEDDNFFSFLKTFYTLAAENMKPGAPYYIFHASSESVNFINALTSAGFLFKQTIVWIKNSLVLGRQDYQWQHEPILYGWKPGAAHKWYGDYDKTTAIDEEITPKEMLQMSKQEIIEIVNDLRNQKNTDVLRVKKPTKSELHPTTKPVKIIQPLVLNSSREGDIVYDPFSGSGATLITCEKLGRQCRAMELDPIYAETILRRWEEYTGLQATKLN